MSKKTLENLRGVCNAVKELRLSVKYRMGLKSIKEFALEYSNHCGPSQAARKFLLTVHARSVTYAHADMHLRLAIEALEIKINKEKENG